ncbi:hypothetical protein N0V88_007988 [Collariella sp. IMI 366227]|nr:hypothetical protein N0V88_007988 [Collariella sp. IMI 366227]
MASNGTTKPAAKPLGFMSKLSPCVYLHDPEGSSPVLSITDATPSLNPPPKLIILASWMGARDPHIAKYLVQYQALYPSSPILLLRSEARHFLRAFHHRAAYLAFTAGLKPPSLVPFPLMHLLCLSYWFQHVLIGRGRTGPIERLRRALNDEVARRAEVRRSYVYGTRDRLVYVADVEAHAEDAVGKGLAG